MTEALWILPENKNSFLGVGGISPNYIIPKDDIHFEIGSLRNVRIWICLSLDSLRCVAVITLHKIERFSEGYYKDDFLLTVNIGKSLRLASDFRSAGAYELPNVQIPTIGLHLISLEQTKELISTIRARTQVRFARPQFKNQSRLSLQLSSASLRAAINHIISTYTLDEIWAAGTGNRLPPVANFASELLHQRSHRSLSELDIKTLSSLDPINQLFTTSGCDLTANLEWPEVDIDLAEIDPAMVYAREFISSNGLEQNLNEALEKTEAAERKHQEMLRDIAEYLKTIGFTPYQSSSIDLLLSYGEKLRVFEIKSANTANILAQISKGVFQLAYYLEALAPNELKLEGILILQKVPGFAAQEVISRIVSRMGFQLLIYDGDRSWPDRVIGLV